jgi:hypothetical protein
MLRTRRLFGAQVVMLVLGIVASSSAQDRPVTPPAVPVEPIAGILDAFGAHAIVGLSDSHGSRPAHAFLLSLIRDPRFAMTVNDIVVEFGNARYQDLVDRFVQGDDVPRDALRLVWRNTTQTTGTADLPLSEEFFDTVREINASLPRERRLRVLLGDPPIDWDTVRTRDDFQKWLEMRETYPASVLRLEVLAKQRRALLVYGSMHFQRKNLISDYDMSVWQAQTIVSLIESAGPERVFTIFRGDERLPALQSTVTSWRAPALAVIKSTTLGAADFAGYYSAVPPRVAPVDGKPVPVPRERWHSLRAEDQFDAILYLGPSSSAPDAHFSPAICTEPGYLAMRLERIALSGVPPFEGKRLTDYCATVNGK